MSLAPSERQALATIEDSLRRTDPRLAAKLATFNVLVTRRRFRRWKSLSPWRLHVRPVIKMAVALAALGLLILIVTVFSHPGPRRGSRGGCSATVVHVTCSPAGGRSSHQNRQVSGAAQAQPAAGRSFGK